MIKTTRLKTSQVPKNITYDLTPQVDGVKQTFELPEKVYDLDQHYVLFNGQVYRNDGNHTFYTISADGMELTTLFDEAPRPGASHVLQFVKTESSEGENAVTKDYVDNKFQEKLTAGTGITIDDDNVISASGATYTAGANITIDADNVISATDTTYSNFVGTDGVDAGAAGLVPAPATTDAGKFLKADGTWDTAGSSITLYTTYGQNTDGAMTQKATTDLVYTAGDPKKINIGDNGVTGGTNSIIIGSEDSGTISSSATDIIAIGHNITDNNNESIAIGHGASTGTSSGNRNAIAIGHNATASNVNAIAIGSTSDSGTTRATGTTSIAIGKNAYANGQGSLCIGRGEAGYTGLVLNTSNDYAEAYADGNYQGFAFAVGPAAYAKNRAMAIGHRAKAVGSTSTTDAIAIGFGADSEYSSSIALGAYAKPRAQGVVDVSTGTNGYGYQGANDQTRTGYRVISGVHDGEQLHDVATVAQGNTLATSAPTTATAGVLGQLYTDTTAMHTYQCTAIDTTDPANPVYTWIQRW